MNYRTAVSFLTLLLALNASTSIICAAQPGFPISFALPSERYVTLVIDDTQGKRVRNLLAETKFSAGSHTVYWDGYDEGATDSSGNLVRHRVAPGVYRVRGVAGADIVLRYEFAVNSPGSPPWFTKDGSGAWLADHCPALGVVFLPHGSGSLIAGGQDQMLICAKAAECGDPLAWTDLAGRKLYGARIAGWNAGDALARDVGARPTAGCVAYAVDAERQTATIRGIGPNGESVGSLTYTCKQSVPFSTYGLYSGGTGGQSIAVCNGIAVVSLPLDNNLVVVDVAKWKVLGAIDIADPKGLCFDPDGTLWIVAGATIQRAHLQIDAAGPALTGLQTVVAGGLEDPQQLTRDRGGDIFVTDWGNSHQVKVFDAAGKYLRSIGHPGGPKLGPYDYESMQFPKCVAIDSKGQLWVTDASYVPKRVSIWTANGTLVKAIIGGPMYGGGGRIDPRDRTRFYYAMAGWGMEFSLDWTTGSYRLKSIYCMPDLQDADRMPGTAPERAIYAGGNQYMVADCNGSLRGNGGEAIWKMDNKTGIAWPIAIADGVHAFSDQHGWKPTDPNVLACLPKWPDSGKELGFWSDLNGDHHMQASEAQFSKPADAFFYNYPTYGDDLSLTFDTEARHVAGPKILANGAPVYDVATDKLLLPGIYTAPDGPQKIAVDVVGVLSAPFMGAGSQSPFDGAFYSNGVQLWTYHTYPMTVIPTKPGQLVAPTRLMGPVLKPSGSELGTVFAVSGEMGSLYLMTTDGLFLKTLGGDLRTKPLLMLPTATRGMAVEGYSFNQEHFMPSIQKTSDGQIYVVAGKETSTIYRVDGLDSFKRISLANVNVGADVLAALPPQMTEAARVQLQQQLIVALLPTAPPDNAAEWPATTQWAAIDDHTQAAVAVSEGKLFAAWKTGEPNLLSNSGGDFRFLFKRGGALDLMIGASGNERLLVTRVNGQTKATLFRLTAANAPNAAHVLYESPIGSVNFDEVVDVSDSVQVAQHGGNYVVSAPITLLGIDSREGEEISGDIGVLRGDDGRTVQRVYWNNLDTSIVSDIPSEARLDVDHWGSFKFAAR